MSRFGDDHIVLDANADPSKSSVDFFVVGGDVEPGLDREYHAGLQLPVFAIDPVDPHIVHVEAEPMAGVVHVEPSLGLVRDQLIDAPR